MTDTWQEVHHGVLEQVRGYERARARNASLHNTDPVPPREPETSERLGLADVDFTGQVPAARILERIEHARALQLASAYGLDLAAELRRGGCTWQPHSHELLLLRPLRPLEELRLRTRLLLAGPDSVWVEGLVLEAGPKGHVLKAISWTRSRWLQLASGRPTAHPERIAALLQQIAVGAPAQARLEDRAEALRFELGRRA
ncbi:hypothetical protein [Nannocystis sp.]|uniref:hypothetical protein n=1 Tax=Nannocystis sp. TaxID=1962667 RepID=UPI0024258B39|nr:hypothetical protein [Nannocystis sp.]MBK7828775.1 hypothetical protein [Nannocystis sp.]MBK9753930.1 hypothetical protein [Nannocystis sp.]